MSRSPGRESLSSFSAYLTPSSTRTSNPERAVAVLPRRVGPGGTVPAMPRKRHVEPVRDAGFAPVVVYAAGSAGHVCPSSILDGAQRGVVRSAGTVPAPLRRVHWSQSRRDNLKVFVEAARRRGEALDHVLSVAPGLGRDDAGAPDRDGAGRDDSAGRRTGHRAQLVR